jgi:hypothetical protein
MEYENDAVPISELRAHISEQLQATGDQPVSKPLLPRPGAVLLAML